MYSSHFYYGSSITIQQQKYNKKSGKKQHDREKRDARTGTDKAFRPVENGVAGYLH